MIKVATERKTIYNTLCRRRRKERTMKGANGKRDEFHWKEHRVPFSLSSLLLFHLLANG